MELLKVKKDIHMPQHDTELIISDENPEDYLCDSKAAAVHTDSSMSPARK